MSLTLQLKTQYDLEILVEEIGFLPLFHNDIPHFSAEDLTEPSFWYDGEDHDPWQWRKCIASKRTIAYGKFFRKKAGFVSRRFIPYFANARRDGYDFDALYDDGKASHAQKRIMDLFTDGDTILLSNVVKQRAGFQKGSGFDTAVTQLQMQLYLLICGFDYKRDKMGAPYGWPVSQYATPEAVFGYEYVRSRYGEQPADSQSAILEQAARICPQADDRALRRLLD